MRPGAGAAAPARPGIPEGGKEAGVFVPQLPGRAQKAKGGEERTALSATFRAFSHKFAINERRAGGTAERSGDTAFRGVIAPQPLFFFFFLEVKAKKSAAIFPQAPAQRDEEGRRREEGCRAFSGRKKRKERKEEEEENGALVPTYHPPGPG